VEFMLKATRDKTLTKLEEGKIINRWLESMRESGHSLLDLKRHLITLSGYYKTVKTNYKEKYQKNEFYKLRDDNKLITENSFILEFPPQQEVYYKGGGFSKSIYSEVEKLNNAEKDEFNKLNETKDISWIYRNREKKDYSIQGFWGRFYPDLIYMQNDQLVLAEIKGREDETDKEKNNLGKLVENLDKSVKFQWINV
jgi:hypothetical protein